MPQARRWPTPASVQTKCGTLNYGTTTSLVDLCHCMALASQAFCAVLGHQRDHVKSAKQAAWLLRHVFTAVARTDTGPRWSVVVLDYGHARAVVEGHAPPQANSGRYLEPVSAYVSTAKSALDRIVIPQEVLDRIASTASPRSSLIISDEALSAESGKGTEFVAVLSNEIRDRLSA